MKYDMDKLAATQNRITKETEGKLLREVITRGRRGGARQGAGRPVGSKIYENGRKYTAKISFNVPDEIKEKLARLADQAGMTQTAVLCALIERAEGL